jgi:hypothetical protein
LSAGKPLSPPVGRDSCRRNQMARIKSIDIEVISTLAIVLLSAVALFTA